MNKLIVGSLFACAVFSSSANATVVSLASNFNITSSGPVFNLVEGQSSFNYGITTTTNTFFDITRTSSGFSNLTLRLYDDLDGVSDLSGTIDFTNNMWAYQLDQNHTSIRISLAAGSYVFRLQSDRTPEGAATVSAISPVPVPAAAGLFGSALFGAGALRRKQKSA